MSLDDVTLCVCQTFTPVEGTQHLKKKEKVTNVGMGTHI